jgi:N-acetylglucosaminyldiphosphoundecaprenol N-acetyl-beta-D-mannosaminyltransferase
MKILTWLDRLYTHGWSRWPDDWRQWLQGNKTKVVFTPNPEQLVMATKNQLFANVLQQADILLPDGMGLLWADWWRQWRARRRSMIGERITGTDVVQWWLSQPAARQERTLCIGGHEGVALALAKQFDTTETWCRGVGGIDNINVMVAAWNNQTHPTVTPEPPVTDSAASTLAAAEAEQRVLLQSIAEWRPTVVLVAFGAPGQEYWVQQSLPALQSSGVKIAMVCGGAFDYLTGRVARAPASWRALGLEWFYRLLHQPWRWRRQLELLTFMRMVWQESWQGSRNTETTSN